MCHCAVKIAAELGIALDVLERELPWRTLVKLCKCGNGLPGYREEPFWHTALWRVAVRAPVRGDDANVMDRDSLETSWHMLNQWIASCSGGGGGGGGGSAADSTAANVAPGVFWTLLAVEFEMGELELLQGNTADAARLFGSVNEKMHRQPLPDMPPYCSQIPTAKLA